MLQMRLGISLEDFMPVSNLISVFKLSRFFLLSNIIKASFCIFQNCYDHKIENFSVHIFLRVIGDVKLCAIIRQIVIV